MTDEEKQARHEQGQRDAPEDGSGEQHYGGCWCCCEDCDERVLFVMPREVAFELAQELHGRTDPNVVRRDCAFCHRERSREDDNHAPECPYWDLLGRTRPT